LSEEQEYDFILSTMRNHFDNVQKNESGKYVEINVDGTAASVDIEQLEVVAENQEVQKRIGTVLQECTVALTAL
jgi:hypothetical protein